MTESTMVAVEAPAMNAMQRVVNTFVAPTKTFEDVRRRSDWWIPFLIASAVGLVYAFVVLHKIGLPTLVDGVMRQSTALESQLSSSTPEQAAAIRSRVEMNFKFMYVAPVFSMVVGLIAAGLLLATANFGAGGKATYKQMLGVWFYGALPLTLFAVVVIAAVLGGVVGDSFNIKNPVGTNIGFYLQDGDLPKTLLPLLSACDLFAIWTAVLLTIGVSIVAKITRFAAGAVVFGWWLVWILLLTAGAAFGG